MAAAPLTTLSLDEFGIACKGILALNHEDFVHFSVCGEYDGQQIIVDPILDKMDADEPFTQLRDIDSLIGVSKDIVVDHAITVYPIGKHQDHLSTDVHIKYTFTNSRGTFTAPLHKVPNACFGDWGERSKILVVIPELYGVDRTSQLTQLEYKNLYELGIRPSMEKLCPTPAQEWSATYPDEMFRARGRNGQLSLGGKLVPEWLVSQLGDTMRESFAENGSLWGTGLVFIHQIRGVKHSTSHRPDADAATDAMRVFLQDNHLPLASLTNDETSRWYIDIGLEISSLELNCLAWRTDSHHSIVGHVLGLNSTDASRITKPGSTLYTRDLTSHLPAVSGCRITPGKNGGTCEAVYLQMYQTDKSLTYRPDGRKHGKFIDAKDILAGKAPEFIKNLCTLYNNAIGKCSSHSRVEVRVPLAFGLTALMGLPERKVRQAMISVERSTWWSVRSYRLTGIGFYSEWQVEGDPEKRAVMPALLLTAAAAWLINGLHSTPDCGASSKDLMRAVLPHVDRIGADINILPFGTPDEDEGGDDDDDDDEDGDDDDSDDDDDTQPTTLPAYPRGMIFLRTLRLGKNHQVPRMSSGGSYSLRRKSFEYIFGTTFEKIVSRLLKAKTVQPRDSNRVSNRLRHTPTYHNWGQNEEGNAFSLEDKGAIFPSRARDAGSDMEEDDEEELEGDIIANTLDRFITTLWYQFLLDVMASAPNTKSASKPGYIKLDAGERTQVNEATYKNTHLSDIFNDCQLRQAKDNEWAEIFGKFFPIRGHTRAGKVQNYTSATYYSRWEDFKERANDLTYTLVRAALFKRFNRLYWMPKAEEDRIWYTKLDPKMKKISGIARNKPSPRILVQGVDPTW